MRDGRIRYWPVTPKARCAGVSPTDWALTPKTLAQQFDRRQDLGVLPPLAVIALHVGPPHLALLVDQEVRTIGVKAILIKDSVGTGDVPFEIAQKVGFHLQLVFELAERCSGIDRDRKYLHSFVGELIEVF